MRATLFFVATLSLFLFFSCKKDKENTICEPCEVIACISCDTLKTGNSGLALCMPFNANARDESKHGYDGTVTGASLITDRFGADQRAYRFSGTSQIQLNNPTQLIGLNQYTYSCWVRFDNLAAAGQSILSIGGQTADQAVIMVNQGGEARIAHISYETGAVNNTNLTSGLVFNINTWYHVVAQRGNGLLKLYVNGILTAQRPTGATAAYTAPAGQQNAAYIGKRAGNIVQHFSGDIDDVRVYNRVLTDTEIAKLFHAVRNCSN